MQRKYHSALAVLAVRASSLARLIYTSRPARHVFLLLLALFTIFLSGYYFGTFDQSIHIPFLKKDVIPGLYPGDPFFELRKTHYSYFWFLFHPFYRMGVLEITLFLADLFSTYLTFLAIWRLSLTLFRSKTTALLSVCAFIFPHIGFAAFPIFEFSLLNRTFVFPFLLISIDWYLKKEYIRSFILLGVLFNLHALSVNFLLFMFGSDLAIRFLRERWREEKKAVLGLSFFLFVLFALPVLLWKFGKSPLDWSLRPEWFHLVSNSMMYTVFYPLAASPNVLLLTVSGVSAFLLYFLNRNHPDNTQHTRSVNNFMYGAVLVIALEVVVSFWLPVTFLVQFQIIRIGIFVLLFGYLYFVRSVVKRYEEAQMSKRTAAMQLGALFFSPTPVIPLAIELMPRVISENSRVIIGWCATLLGFAFFAWFAIKTNVWMPGIHIFPQKTDWYATQIWAKDNTEKDTLFITPPEKWWLFEPDWRVFSERSTVVTLSEVLEFAFTPEYTKGWIERFDMLAPGARQQFAGDVAKSKLITENAYLHLSDEQFLAAATKYHASYIVVEKQRVLPLPLVYQNNSFSVYKVPVRYAVTSSS